MSLFCSRESLPCDDDFLDLRCALVDAERADFPIELFDDVAAAHAIATMELHSLVDDRLRAVGGVEFCYRGLARDARRAVILGPGGAIDEQRRSVDIDRHFGD